MAVSGIRRRWSGFAALVAAAALAVGAPLAAAAATPGVGDTSDAMRYDTTAPFGTPIAGLSGADDDTETLTAPFALNFFGVTSHGLCVTTNGGFYPVPADSDGCSDDYNKNIEHLALESEASMIAALAADIDLGACADNTDDGFGLPCEIYYGETTVDGRDAFIITWYRVAMYNDENDSALDNTFQIVIIKKATGDDTVGWDFDIEFNYGHLNDGEGGYSAADPSSDCSEAAGDPNCRWGIGWASFDPGTDPVDTADDTATPFELFASTPVSGLIDGAATSLVTHSLNSAVLGRYTFSMVGGVTQGFSVPALAPEPALAETGSAGPNFVVIASALTVVVAGIALVGFRRRRAA